MEPCPYCGSEFIVKYGKRKTQKGSIQVYKCKSCNKYFSHEKFKHKRYDPKIILNAISIYNLGYTVEQTRKEIAKKFHIKVPESTIYSWIKEYSEICTFTKIRKKAKKMFEPVEIILSMKLNHKQIYNFQLHRAKLELKSKELPEERFKSLKNYLEFVQSDKFPHNIFVNNGENSESRASQIKVNLLEITEVEKQNLANKLADFGLILAKSNKDRHSAVQNFMLINDSVTIATEVPVYLTKRDIIYFKKKGFVFELENYKTPITGHIDILQIRNGLIYILDYKPEAKKVNAVSQLTIYALALASRTKIAVKYFKCAWFDDKNYFEFFPLHAVYPKL